MVGFDIEIVAAFEMGLHEAGHIAEVGAKAEFEVIQADGERHGIDRIVLDGKGVDVQIAVAEGFAGGKYLEAGSRVEVFHDPFGGFGIGKDGDVVLIGEDFQALDVIGMLMGDQNGVDFGDIDVDFGEFGFQGFCADAGVDQDLALRGA